MTKIIIDSKQIEELRAENERLRAIPEKVREACARTCENYMRECLDDRDIQKRWPDLCRRNQVYASAIRALDLNQIIGKDIST